MKFYKTTYQDINLEVRKLVSKSSESRKPQAFPRVPK